MPLVQVTDNLKGVIKSERKKRKIRGDTLSKNIGKSPSYISQIERGLISTIDVNILFNIFKSIIDLPEKDFPDYLNNIIGDNIQLSNDEIKHEEWEINMEYQFRQFPITKEIIEYLNAKLNELDISAETLIKEINLNKELSESLLNSLKENICFVRVNEKGTINSSIKFNLPKKFIIDVLNKKIKSINKITMEGILFNLFLLEGKNSIDAHILSEQKLKEFKFFTLDERNEIINKAQKDKIELDSVILHEDNECNNFLNKVIEYLTMLRDMNPVYGIEVFSTFYRNLNDDKLLTFALMKLEIYKLSKLTKKQKNEFLLKINELIDLYTKDISSDEDNIL